MKGTEDAILVRRVLSGEREAYALLVERHGSAVRNLAWRMTGSPDEAGDLAQEIFLRAYSSLAGYDLKRPFFSWLYTLALNLIRSHLRARKRDFLAKAKELNEELGKAALAGEDVQGPEGRLEALQDAVLVRKGVLALPDKLREALVLRFYMDLSFEETAQVLRVSVSAAKMRVYRGLDRLRELIGQAEINNS